MHFATTPQGAGRAPPKRRLTQNSSTGKKTTCACDPERIRVSGKPLTRTYGYIYVYMYMYVYAYVHVYARLEAPANSVAAAPLGAAAAAAPPANGLGILWTS